jgi:hypothetical protein
MWHSWHLNRLEAVARDCPENGNAEKWLEAKTVLRRSRPFFSSAQVKVWLPV